MTGIHYNAAHHRKTSNYLWLLIWISALVFFPFFSFLFKDYYDVAFRVVASIFIVWGAYVVTQTLVELRISLTLALLALVGFWAAMITGDGWNATVFQTITGFIYFLYLGLRIVKQLIEHHDEVNLNLVYGAIACYLLIGIIGGQLAILLDASVPGSFFVEEAQSDSYAYYYFSLVTLTTVGYGDISPHTDAGRALALFIALLGQIYLTIAIAIIIGKYLASQQSQ